MTGLLNSDYWGVCFSSLGDADHFHACDPLRRSRAHARTRWLNKLRFASNRGTSSRQYSATPNNGHTGNDAALVAARAHVVSVHHSTVGKPYSNYKRRGRHTRGATRTKEALLPGVHYGSEMPRSQRRK